MRRKIEPSSPVYISGPLHLQLRELVVRKARAGEKGSLRDNTDKALSRFIKTENRRLDRIGIN